ncbi:MAG: FtsH protease activity modulator HflK [Pseudomonadota bacterium]
MAWNEPGGARDKDPWGGRKSTEQGPPDLDELLRKLQQRLRGLFGGKRPEGPDAKPLRPGFGLLAAIVVIVWLLSGIYIVDPAERGVVQRFGAYAATTLPGPHWHIPYPIEKVNIVNVDQIRNVEIGFRSDGLKQTVEAVPREALMLTQDENIVDVRFAVQYHVKDARDYLFNVREPDFTLLQATESAVREIIGKSSMDFVLTEGRGQVEDTSREMIQKILDRYRSGLQVTKVNMQNAQPPEEVQDAFQDAVRAIADEQRLINEAETYANGVIPAARGEAARRLAEANAYKAQVVAQAQGEASRFTQVLEQYRNAPDVTRERLYLEAMEAVLSNTDKIMVDIKSGNNLLYLPLDRLAQPAQRAPEPAPEAPAASAEQVAAEPKQDTLRDRGRSRGER